MRPTYMLVFFSSHFLYVCDRDEAAELIFLLFYSDEQVCAASMDAIKSLAISPGGMVKSTYHVY